MLCGNAAMMQASSFDSVVFYPFTFVEDGLPASEVNIGGCQIGDAFMVAQMIGKRPVSPALFGVGGWD